MKQSFAGCFISLGMLNVYHHCRLKTFLIHPSKSEILQSASQIGEGITGRTLKYL
ncbi:hypothetical protein AVDCRST_MAG92-2348 [uncultured Coleofasciculus sp.]|uniref:Uncharacterized protein n=1 Tax=uncultured Coleofasciculus sp. TaxID=1267456 RepID=A0A6J4IQF8_9CYAN|nr:hypothetical protein AVDCRST_MAG92-2348 [uncultured Coleofasciculus sp.]